MIRLNWIGEALAGLILPSAGLDEVMITCLP